jgi:hypothetical protein
MTTCGHITKQIDSKELEEATSKNKAYELKIKNGQEALDKLIKEKDAKFEEFKKQALSEKQTMEKANDDLSK